MNFNARRVHIFIEHAREIWIVTFIWLKCDSFKSLWKFYWCFQICIWFQNTIAHRCCGRSKRSGNQAKHESKSHHRVNRPRYPSAGSRQTITTFTKKNSGEGNNNTKKHKRNDENFTIKLSRTEDHDVSSGLLNSITGRLYRSTRSVFRPKVDDLDSSVQSAGYSSRRIQCGSTESGRSHSISNSSLQDLEGEEFTGKELVTFMEQVNNNIYQWY